MYCTNCGNIIDDNATECPYCKSTQAVIETSSDDYSQLNDFRKFSRNIGRTIGKGLGIGINIGLDIGKGIKDGILNEYNKKWK